MTDVRQLQEWIKSDLGESKVASVCTSIVERIAHLPPDQVQHIPLQTLADFASTNDIETVVKAAQYLTFPPTSFLTLYFELVDDEGEHHLIEADEYISARKNGWLVHPDRGEKIPNFEDHLFVFYKANLNGPR